jgi:hypothetical protein
VQPYLTVWIHVHNVQSAHHRGQVRQVIDGIDSQPENSTQANTGLMSATAPAARESTWALLEFSGYNTGRQRAANIESVEPMRKPNAFTCMRMSRMDAQEV